MAFTTEIKIKRSFDVNCAFDTVFALLADVPKSAGHFPKVEQLVPMGDNTFRWDMEKIGIDKYFIQTVYACKYSNMKAVGLVKWAPVPGVGNGLVQGQWNIKKTGEKSTHIDFDTKGDLTIDLPALVKIVVAPLVGIEFNSLVDKYIENLKKTFAS